MSCNRGRLLAVLGDLSVSSKPFCVIDNLSNPVACSHISGRRQVAVVPLLISVCNRPTSLYRCRQMPLQKPFWASTEAWPLIAGLIPGVVAPSLPRCLNNPHDYLFSIYY